MKRYILLILGVLLALPSCQKESDVVQSRVAEAAQMHSLSVTVQTPGSESTTRVVDEYGTGQTVNRVIFELYSSDDSEAEADDFILNRRVVKNLETDFESNSKYAEFELEIPLDLYYYYVVWADYSAADEFQEGKSYEAGEDNDEELDSSLGSGFDYHYTTSEGLRNITTDYSNHLGNDETRDAFSYASGIFSFEENNEIVEEAILTRPLYQLNL